MSAIDRAIMDELAQVMGGEFPGLVRTYLESTPGLIRQLETAAQQNGVDALIQPAHSLKASSNDLGAMQLAEIAQTIEHAARAGNDSARDPVPELQDRFEKARGELQEILGS